MIRYIYQQIRKSLIWVKSKTDSIIRENNSVIIKSGMFSVLLLISVAGASTIGSNSARKNSGAKNLAVEFCLEDSTKNKDSKNHSEFGQFVLSEERPENFIDISAPLESMQSQMLLQKTFQPLNNQNGKVSNVATVVSLHNKKSTLQDLNKTFKFINRYMYVGSKLIETDSSRVELFNRIGRHEPINIRIANFRRNFRLPIFPETVLIKWNHVILDPFISTMVPRSKVLKPFISCVLNSITIGPFSSQMITRPSNHPLSRLMYESVRAAQTQHILMRHQLDVLNALDPPILHLFVNTLLQRHPPINMMPDFVDANQHNLNRRAVRALLFPNYVDRPIPRHCETDNRFLLDDGQVRSVSSGMCYEINLLPPCLMMLRQHGSSTDYVTQRMNIYFRKTRTDIMNTRLMEVKLNITAIAFDALRALTIRTPLVKKSYPVIQDITDYVQYFFPVQMSLQIGHQHSDSIDFNLNQERVRTSILNARNLIILDRLQALQRVTFFGPIYRRGLITGMDTIHSRVFCDVKCLLTFNFDVFELLEKLTRKEHKSLS